MLQTQIIQKSKIKLSTLELINFSIIFIILAVALPWIMHQFNLAGPTFLPLHLFVLVAGLLLGWRVGLLVGLFTPLISHLTSGLPLAIFLPQITIELMLYGLSAGFFREILKLNIYFSLILAMILGRLGLFMAMWILGTSPSGPLVGVSNVISLGWPGIIIQLILVPLGVVWLQKYLPSFNNKAA